MFFFSCCSPLVLQIFIRIFTYTYSECIKLGREKKQKKKRKKHKNRGKREKVFTIKQKQKKDREKEIRDVIMYGAATAHHYAWGIYHVCIFHRILTKMTDLWLMDVDCYSLPYSNSINATASQKHKLYNKTDEQIDTNVTIYHLPRFLVFSVRLVCWWEM